VLSPVVCLLSVTLMHLIQTVEIFGNISTAFGTSAIHWHPQKILWRSSQGNPSVGELNPRGVGSKIAIFDLWNTISRKRCKIGGKLVLITNTKSHISFRLVHKIGDLEWPWTRLRFILNAWLHVCVINIRIVMAVILRYFCEIGRFRGALHKSGWRYTQTFCDRNVAIASSF